MLTVHPRFLYQVSIWLYDILDFKLEGKIIVGRRRPRPGRGGRSCTRQEADSVIAAMSSFLFILPLHAHTHQGFDEFMNVVLDDAEEVWVKVSKKAEGEESSGGSSRSKKAYGDRTHLGGLDMARQAVLGSLRPD